MSMAASRSIRRMRPADAEAVAGLLSASWKRTYEHLMGLEKVEAANARLHAPEALLKTFCTLSRPFCEGIKRYLSI